MGRDSIEKHARNNVYKRISTRISARVRRIRGNAHNRPSKPEANRVTGRSLKTKLSESGIQFVERKESKACPYESTDA